MKKKFFMAAALTVAAVSGATYGHLSQNASSDSDMLLANAEALTRDEASGKKLTCYNSITSKEGSQVRYCPICSYIDGTDRWYSPSSECEPTNYHRSDY